jgi:hypothetical protein
MAQTLPDLRSSYVHPGKVRPKSNFAQVGITHGRLYRMLFYVDQVVITRVQLYRMLFYFILVGIAYVQPHRMLFYKSF